MPTAYTVKQGDHLSRIADQFGFSDYRVIWDYAGNADLKAQRKNPHVLFPGDSVIIPDKEQRPQPRSLSASSSACAAMGPGRQCGAANRARSRISSVRWAQAALPWRRKCLRAATAQRRATIGAPAASAAWARVISA